MRRKGGEGPREERVSTDTLRPVKSTRGPVLGEEEGRRYHLDINQFFSTKNA